MPKRAIYDHAVAIADQVKAAIEKVKGSPVSRKVMMATNLVGRPGMGRA